MQTNRHITNPRRSKSPTNTQRLSHMGIRGLQSKISPAQFRVRYLLPPVQREAELMLPLKAHHVSILFHTNCLRLTLRTDPTKTEEKGFNFVPILPSPNPAELGPKAMKQLMTTGTLMATPRVIQSDDIAESITADSPFRIAEVSRRETISRQLSNKASKSLKEKAELMGLRTPGIVGKTLRTPGGSSSVRRDMPPPSWTPRADAPGNLTPAAKRLLERTTFGSAAASRRAEAMEKGAAWDAGKGRGQEPNQIRWTPTPNAGR